MKVLEGEKIKTRTETTRYLVMGRFGHEYWGCLSVCRTQDEAETYARSLSDTECASYCIVKVDGLPINPPLDKEA